MSFTIDSPLFQTSRFSAQSAIGEGGAIGVHALQRDDNRKALKDSKASRSARQESVAEAMDSGEGEGEGGDIAFRVRVSPSLGEFFGASFFPCASAHLGSRSDR